MDLQFAGYSWPLHAQHSTLNACCGELQSTLEVCLHAEIQALPGISHPMATTRPAALTLAMRGAAARGARCPKNPVVWCTSIIGRIKSTTLSGSHPALLHFLRRSQHRLDWAGRRIGVTLAHITCRDVLNSQHVR